MSELSGVTPGRQGKGWVAWEGVTVFLAMSAPQCQRAQACTSHPHRKFSSHVTNVIWHILPPWGSKPSDFVTKQCYSGLLELAQHHPLAPISGLIENA